MNYWTLFNFILLGMLTVYIVIWLKNREEKTMNYEIPILYHKRLKERLNHEQVLKVIEKAKTKCNYLEIKSIKITRIMGFNDDYVGFTVSHKKPRNVFTTGLETRV